MVTRPGDDRPAGEAGADGITFAELLALLDYQDGDTREHIAIHFAQGSSMTFPLDVVLPCDAPRRIAWKTDIGHHGMAPIAGRVDFDFWFSINPTAAPPCSRGSRGRSPRVIRLAALYADIDVGKPVYVPGLKYCPDLATAELIITEIARVLGGAGKCTRSGWCGLALMGGRRGSLPSGHKTSAN
jgi:hypothetical protein